MPTELKAPREFSDTSREKMAGRGVAMPDGSYPIPDKDALRRAIASFGGAKNKSATKRHIVKRARALGATDMLPDNWQKASEPTKVWPDELKAEPMTTGQLDRWLKGRIPRRILMVPFGGPLPGGKAGLDLDGEFFDGDTDLYGPFPALRRTRERLVDWHHDNDPTGRMKGAILGHVVFDADAEDDGVWADFWANAGEERRNLIARLERGGVPLYGSSQAVRGAVRKADDGHIEVWPLVRHTITTSPQNIYAVVPPLKALLTADLPIEEAGAAAVRAAFLGLGKARLTLPSTFPEGSEHLPSGSEKASKAGRVISRKTEARLVELLGNFVTEHKRLVAELNRQEFTEP